MYHMGVNPGRFSKSQSDLMMLINIKLKIITKFNDNKKMDPKLKDCFVLKNGLIERTSSKLYKKNMTEEFRYVLKTQLQGFELSEDSLFSSIDGWHFNTDLYSLHYKERYDNKLCICGKKIKELCYIYFKNKNWSFQVGNCCIKKHLKFLYKKYCDSKKLLNKDYETISFLLKNIIKESFNYICCKSCDKICNKKYSKYSNCMSCLKIINLPIEYFIYIHKNKQLLKKNEYESEKRQLWKLDRQLWKLDCQLCEWRLLINDLNRQLLLCF